MKKYLVIGNPIDHSLSPKLQNWWLKENNIDATYDKIKLEDSQIKNFIQVCPKEMIDKLENPITNKISNFAS